VAAYVYLICSGDLHKIGWSKDPESRLGALGGRSRCRVVHAFPCGSPRRVERRLHDYFDGKRSHGEWFRLDESDVLLFRLIGACRTTEDLPQVVRSAPDPEPKDWGQSYGLPQLNIRMDDEGFEILAEAGRRLAHSVGFTPSQSDVVRAGLVELLRRYLPVPPGESSAEPQRSPEPGGVEEPKEPAEPKRKRGRPRKGAGESP
jgi:hypothetical protein